MSIQNNTLRRLAAGVGAAALALVGVVGVGTAASAAVDDTVGPDQPNAPTSGTLTINKYSGSPVGVGETPNPDNLLSGVEFTVTQVGRLDGTTCNPIDLTDADDWDGLLGLFGTAPAEPTAPFCLLTGDEYVHTGVTDEGKAEFDLDVGIYFVQETDPGDHNIVSPVPNFYVSIPTSLGEDGDGWTYDVVADPKNQLMEQPSKVVNEDQFQEGFVIGATVEWTMTVPIPTLNNGETFNEAVITDDLDSRLSYVAGSSSVTIGEGDDMVTFVDGTDYNVTGNAVWTFTEAGRLKLNANMGESLTIVFDTTVNSVGTGEVPNDDYESKFNGTTVPGEKVPYTYWGQLEIFKADDSEPAIPLEGAEFQVFLPNAAGECVEPGAEADRIAIGTSDDDGVVQWVMGQNDDGPILAAVLGLWIANSEDGVIPAPEKDYCVYETVVPAGHTPVEFENLVTIEPGETNIFTLPVTNAKKPGPDLPLTGAQGTMVMTLGGLLLVGAGAGALVVSRRRNEA